MEVQSTPSLRTCTLNDVRFHLKGLQGAARLGFKLHWLIPKLKNFEQRLIAANDSAFLRQQSDELQSRITSLKGEITELQGRIASLDGQLAPLLQEQKELAHRILNTRRLTLLKAPI